MVSKINLNYLVDVARNEIFPAVEKHFKADDGIIVLVLSPKEVGVSVSAGFRVTDDIKSDVLKQIHFQYLNEYVLSIEWEDGKILGIYTIDCCSANQLVGYESDDVHEIDSVIHPDFKT